MKELKNFVKNNSPNRRISKLIEHKAEIFKLYEDGYQVEQIVEFLYQQYEITTSTRNIYYFLKGATDKKNFSIKTPKVTDEVGQNSDEQESSEEQQYALKNLRKNLKRMQS